MYNILEYSIIKSTLFFINKGFEADISFKTKECEELIPYTVVKVDKVHKLQDKLRQNLTFFNKVIEKFTNKKRV